MIDPLVFRAFVDEFVKQGSDSYYRRNRHEILAKQRVYRQAHGSQIARSQKRYRQRVSTGAHRPRKRYTVGNSYVYNR